jgi:hypothetical protein
VKPNVTPVTEDKNVLEAVSASQVEITDIYTEQSYDELKDVLSGYLNPDDKNEETVEFAGNGVETSEVVQKSQVSGKDVSEAFDDLFGK